MRCQYVPFRPALSGQYLDRFYERIQMLPEQPSISLTDLDIIVREELEWARNQSLNPKQKKIYSAAWLLFRDLIRTDWSYRWKAGVEVAPPPLVQTAHSEEEVKRAKDTIRRMMHSAKIEKVYESREFINRMETPPKVGRTLLPIQFLIADGQALYQDLFSLAQFTSEDELVAGLKQVIRPYLEFVEVNKRCEQTGQLLSDIWRYFRFTWATPSENTPGRTMLYLIRDAARPYHPVMAIISLENAPFRITPRDRYIGWTPDAFIETINGEDEKEIRDGIKKLVSYVNLALSEIDITGLCSSYDCEKPNDEIISKLEYIATVAHEQRRSSLKIWHEKGGDEEELEQSDLGNISLDTEKALFREKRADQLAKLLFSKLELLSFLESKDLVSRWRRFIETEIGQSAIRSALLAVKNRHVGTSILEMNVCGAIPPYNELLAGKLAAMLAISPIVVADYKKRYGDRPSDIASRMKGEKVVRPANLLFVSTSSLYQVGSSQYNRLRFPKNLLKDDAPEIRWAEIGETSGYGTLHISRQTLQHLVAAASDDGLSYINHIFGEGPSPKLRAIKDALQVVLEPGYSDELTKHSMSRIIYGVWVAENGRAILNGSAEPPNYYFDVTQDSEEQTAQIVDHWKIRWLANRIKYMPALESVRAFECDSLLVGNTIPYTELPDLVATSEEPNQMLNESLTGSQLELTNFREFVRSLYRGASSYADETEVSQLREIHVETNLDQAILTAVRNGKSIVLTGNPGDGKTHLLRVLKDELEKISPFPVIELDASAVSNGQLKNKWESAYQQSASFCVAINEAVLKNLADEYKEFKPIQEAWWQVEHTVVYDDLDAPNHSVVVFDLSRRNILSSEVVNKIFTHLTDPNALKLCEKCPKQGCDLALNQKLMQSERFQARLQLVLDRVSRRGYHATLRELLSLVSFLLFAGRSCEKIINQSGVREWSLPQLPYKGKGPLFDAIKKTFDPALISHPEWDDILVNAETSAHDWIDGWTTEADAIPSDKNCRVDQRKRAFFYFHASGEALLEISSDDESHFATFLNQTHTNQRDSLRMILKRINKFFGDERSSDKLKIWQSHRYNQSPRAVLYSVQSVHRQDFELVWPKLSVFAKHAFSLSEDHVLLRLKTDEQVRLKIDFPLFKMLAQADRGIPELSIDNEFTRRLWQFMEQLSKPVDSDEVVVTLLDVSTHETLSVGIDTEKKQFLSIQRED